MLINNLHVEASASRFMPRFSDASSMDGLNVHGAVIDELHAHRTRHVCDVLETAIGARRQPMSWEITTAGYDRDSIWVEHNDYAMRLLEGTLQTTAGRLHRDPPTRTTTRPSRKVWRKANPSFGLSVKPADLASKAEQAIACPAPRTPSGACA